MDQLFSFWEKERFLATFDVLIVGGGLVGLMTAYQTKKQAPGLRVGVVESGFLPTGASTKNAGFACFGSVSELMDRLETATEEELLSVISLRWRGLKLLRQILGDSIIDYRPYGGFEVFKKDEVSFAEACLAQIGHFNSLLAPITGSADVYSPVSTEKIKSWGLGNTHGVIQNQLEGQLDTGKMMMALIRLVQQEGVLLFTGCEVEEIDGGETVQTLITNRANFRARRVVLATNAFSRSLFPELDVVPGRGQVLVTEPIKNLKIRGAFHYDRGYYYFRNIGDRILLGGGRNLDQKAEETTEFGLSDVVQHKLEELLTEVILPGKKPTIEYRWSGIMAFGSELKPIVGEVVPGVYVAVRCSGMGIAMGSQIGKDVAEMVVERF